MLHWVVASPSYAATRRLSSGLTSTEVCVDINIEILGVGLKLKMPDQSRHSHKKPRRSLERIDTSFSWVGKMLAQPLAAKATSGLSMLQ